MNEHPTVFETPLQEIDLKSIEFKGLVIDIGGGGEGLVSRLEGERVCAVDVSLDRIREARIHGPSAHWTVADGCSLCFRRDTFNVATLWFSLGYMRDWETKKAVLEEAHRVLRPNGILSILAANVVSQQDRFLFNAQFTFPDGSISQISYGLVGNQNQSLEAVAKTLENSGFALLGSSDNRHWFRITAKSVE
ncbi:MAG: class I SAM-dependent methyltransferase [Candidatus Thorarchaeota archaeon]